MSSAEPSASITTQAGGHQGREKHKVAGQHRQGQGRRRSTGARDGSHSHSVEKGNKSRKSGVRSGSVKRLTKEHSFLTDVADVRAMEQGLLQLLGDFHSGKLRAFNDGATFEKMDQVREQQERLARLHFELDVHQDLHRLGTEEARTTANENLSKLIDQLHNLSMSIQTLQPGVMEKEEKKTKH
ncbi:coiled-coil domain-containing protein 28B-like [Littorina saxatilis]|uniref:coiled-coil domain-containing protein 28B-like n=1 Tax=Littorina saxatilis TaxID=31220 RepID=UPI0038B6603C